MSETKILTIAEPSPPPEIWFRVMVRKRRGRKLSKQQEEVLIRATDTSALQIKLADFKGAIDGYQVARLHECTICSHTGPWTETWQWFGSYAKLDEGAPVVKICSPECDRKAVETKLVPRNAPRIDVDHA